MTERETREGPCQACEDAEFYHGVLAALAVVAAHDQPVIAQDIVNTISKRKLFKAAEQYDLNVLARLGIKL